MTQLATFGAGCFWGVEYAFKQLPGVIATTVGYMGGVTEHPTYEQVCSGTTQHTEVCQVEFDPDQITYDQLLDKFWTIHDPTQLNRQGPDVGYQYRSVIFYHNDDQLLAAQESIKQLQVERRYRASITTAVQPAETFWPAEDYHQDYVDKHPGATC